MSETPERARRLAARRRAKEALRPLRALVRVLSEWERLEAADAIGVLRIDPGLEEADYASDVLDIVAQAVREAGQSMAVEVFVVSTAADHSSPDEHRRDRWESRTERAQGSTRTSAPGGARAARS